LGADRAAHGIIPNVLADAELYDVLLVVLTSEVVNELLLYGVLRLRGGNGTLARRSKGLTKQVWIVEPARARLNSSVSALPRDTPGTYDEWLCEVAGM
jgi:hypothetical protein